MAGLRMPCYGYTAAACTDSLCLEFGFEAGQIRIVHSCANVLWFNTQSSVATTAHCPLTSGQIIDINSGGRTTLLSYVTTSCNKTMNIFALGL